MPSRERVYSLSDNIHPTTMRGGGTEGKFSPRARKTSLERIVRSHSASFGLPSDGIPAPLSTFQPVVDYRPHAALPSTPHRSLSPVDGSASPDCTPAWMRPLHLVDEEKSIYQNIHGEEWRDHPLCLYCFRQHGNLHRILQFGCEVCGRGEVLRGLYWEFPC